LSSSSKTNDVSMVPKQQGQPIASVGWALRRAALGLLMLFVMVMLAAWLLYTSIDPNEAAAAKASPLLSGDRGDSRGEAP
jgi:hypothetical protein